MLVSERQHTERSSQLPIEEIYTNHDINPHLQHDKTTGYNFDFPSKWANADSTNKVIALRKLEIAPTSHNFNMALRIYKGEVPIVEEDGWDDWTSTDNNVTRSLIKPPFFAEGSHFTFPQFFNDGPNDAQSKDFSYEFTNNANGDFIGYSCVAKSSLVQYNYVFTKEGNEYVTTIFYRLSSDEVETEWFQSLDKCYSITDENSLIEIIHLIVQELCPFLTHHNLKITYKYDYKKGSILISIVDKNLAERYFEFKFLNDEDAAEFLRLFNQDLSFFNWQTIADHRVDKHFTADVWDRKHAQFHSTFSDAKRNYIGSNKDDLSHVNKLFKYAHGNTSFNIRFTTDGLNNFLPKYCNFMIELVFILNYKNNVIT